MDNEDVRKQGKAELMTIERGLMPQGAPGFAAVVKYPTIAELTAAHGRKTMHKAILLLVKDLCSSLNLVRNMAEGQMIEVAGFLLDECGNFRLEDYVMLFGLMKRGKLVKIYDRIDMQVVGLALDEYWKIRHEAGEQIMGDRQDFDFSWHPANEVLKDGTSEILQALKDDVAKQKRIEQEEYERVTRMRDERLKELGWDLSGKVQSSEVIDSFCTMYLRKMKDGEVLDKIDQQFYANNSKAIEAELKRRAENG